jgi:UDP-N-acetyl-D-mannosaminuronic acid dehydrogenase
MGEIGHVIGGKEVARGPSRFRDLLNPNTSEMQGRVARERHSELVAVVGAGGHVGLPLSVVLADAGYDVIGIDCDEETNEKLSRGVVPYVEHGAEELLTRSLERGNLRFTSSDEALARANVLVVIIGTPIDDNLNPRLDPLIEIFERHAGQMPQDQLIILRSTVSPGTTELLRTILEERTGKREGRDFFLVFAPERVLQTHAIREIRGLPQLIGAFSDTSFERAEAFFNRFVKSSCIRLTPVEAELGKLITNMARYISFAVANEIYMICDTYSANAHKVIDACNADYPRLDLPRPGPNVGGPCLYKDGYYLIDRIAYPEIIASAFKINESVTRFLLEKVRQRVTLRRACVLGMTFKADCDDTRNSLSFKLQKQLRSAHCEPIPVDPYLPGYEDLNRIRGVQALFLMTPHKVFRDLGPILEAIDNPDCIIVDMWNYWQENQSLSHNGMYTVREALLLRVKTNAGCI